MIPSHASLAQAALDRMLKAPLRRSCNRHDDCDAADQRQHERWVKLTWQQQLHEPMYSEHCHDDCCEECFGK